MKKEQRKKDRAKAEPSTEKRFTITLDNVSKPDLEPYSDKKEAKPLTARLEDDDDADGSDNDQQPGKERGEYRSGNRVQCRTGKEHKGRLGSALELKKPVPQGVDHCLNRAPIITWERTSSLSPAG